MIVLVTPLVMLYPKFVLTETVIKLSIFLKGLNDQYLVVRSQIMLMDPFPNICKVYSLLFPQERQAITPLDE